VIAVAVLGSACTPPGDAAGGSSTSLDLDDTSTSTSTTSTTTHGGPGDDDAADDPEPTIDTGADEGSRCDDAQDDGGTSGGDAGETFGGMGGDIPIGATVFAVRQHEVAQGELVEVSDLVVTSPVGITDAGLIVFAQAPEGGAWSAIAIVSAYDDIVATQGDRITVVGNVVYDGNYPRVVLGLHEDSGIAIDGTEALPPAVVIALADLGSDPAGTLDPYEGAVMHVETPQVSDADVCPGEFALTADLRVDDLFLGDQAPTPSTGASFTAIVGPLRWTTDGYEVAPRTPADLVE
jgi:hypothetical protein